MKSVSSKGNLKEKWQNNQAVLSMVILESEQQGHKFPERSDIENLQYLIIVKTDNKDSLFEAVADSKPDIVFLHIESAGTDWFGIILKVKELNPGTKIIVFSSFLERRFILKIMKSGVYGYITDNGSSTELLKALEVVHNGGVYLSKEILSDSGENQQIPSYIDIVNSNLSNREREVIRLIGEGLSAKEIAFELLISLKTVETYRTRVMEKLDIYSIAGLTKYAISAGLIEL